MEVEEHHLSKVFLAGLRTQPDPVDTSTSLETEQLTLGTALVFLA